MYRVDIVHEKDVTFNIKARDYECVVDAKGNSGLTPSDALLASLGSCIGVYIHKYSRTAKLNLLNFKIIVEAEFSQESPVCFKAINVVVTFQDALLDERRKNALLEFIKNCPIHNTLKGTPQINIQLS